MVEIRDYVVWVKHIHGKKELGNEIEALSAGDLIKLEIADTVGIWEKMDDGADGRPTPGIKPIGRARDHWHALYRRRRGDVVSIARVG